MKPTFKSEGKYALHMEPCVDRPGKAALVVKYTSERPGENARAVVAFGSPSTVRRWFRSLPVPRAFPEGEAYDDWLRYSRLLSLSSTPVTGCYYLPVVDVDRIRIDRQGYDVVGVYWGPGGLPLFRLTVEDGRTDYERHPDRKSALARVKLLALAESTARLVRG